MNYGIYLWIWALVFAFAVVTGAVVGWLVGKFATSTAGSLVITICVSLLAGWIVSERIFPGQTQYQYPLMFFPPILLAMLLGLWLGRLGSIALRR